MAVEVKLPQLAASMADGMISKWLKNVGEAIDRGEPLFEVESDKVTTEVESPASGIVRQILVPEGQKVDVGTVLAVIAGAEEALPAATTGGAGTLPASLVSGPVEAPVATQTSAARKQFVTPRARMTAAELGVDLAGLKGTGPGGRILERDVVNAAAVAPTAASPTPVAVPASPPPPAVVAPSPAAVPGTTVPFTGMRRTIAERMVRSQQTVAEVTITSEVDMTEVVKLREQVSGEWERTHGMRVSYTEVIVKAVARALKEHPYVNASLTDEGIRLHDDVNVGVAVALDEGLIVPVVRDADLKPLLEIAREVRGITERARSNRLTRDDVSGGTFTVSNAGMFGVEVFTPIINWPECAILGVGRVAEKAVVRNGQIVARPVMWLSLTFDHRIVDGAPAAVFLARVRQLLESPYLLFV